jgi:hypothetical protein
LLRAGGQSAGTWQIVRQQKRATVGNQLVGSRGEFAGLCMPFRCPSQLNFLLFLRPGRSSKALSPDFTDEYWSCEPWTLRALGRGSREFSNPSVPANSLRARAQPDSANPALSANPLPASPSTRRPSIRRCCNPSFAGFPPPARTGIRRRNTGRALRSCRGPVARCRAR